MINYCYCFYIDQAYGLYRFIGGEYLKLISGVANVLTLLGDGNLEVGLKIICYDRSCMPMKKNQYFLVDET